MSADLTALLDAALIAAVPLILAALGESFAERSGLLNLGIEGMMIAGAFFGFWAVYESENILLGMALGILAGLVLALMFGVLTIAMRVDQVIVGLATTIFAAGITSFLYRDVYGGQNPISSALPREISIPLLRDLPIIGEPLFEQSWLFYVAFALVPVFAYVLARTKFGLEVRAVGEHPFAADAAGVNVVVTRFAAIAIGGVMAGFAGAFLAVADVKLFQIGMTVGQGFIALAITMLGRWNPYRILVGAVMFGLLRSLGTTLQIRGIDDLFGIPLRVEFIGMLPYIGIMLALVLLAGRTQLPSALGIPYERGRRA